MTPRTPFRAFLSPTHPFWHRPKGWVTLIVVGFGLYVAAITLGWLLAEAIFG